MSSNELCVWCDNSGWLHLRRWVRRRAANGNTYDEQLQAPCGFCEAGHRHHERFGGPWNYAVEEIDAVLNLDEQRQLTPAERAAWEKVKQAGARFAERAEQIELTPDEREMLASDL